MVVKHILDIHKALINDNFSYKDIYTMVVNDIIYEYSKLLQQPLFIPLWNVAPCDICDITNCDITKRKKELFDSYRNKLYILSENDVELGLILKDLLQKSSNKNETEIGATRCPLCNKFTIAVEAQDDMMICNSCQHTFAIAEN